MEKWNIERYVVRRLTWENKVEYWDFFLDKWVTPENVNDDCVTTYSAASCVQKESYGSKIVEMRVIIEEK